MYDDTSLCALTVICYLDPRQAIPNPEIILAVGFRTDAMEAFRAILATKTAARIALSCSGWGSMTAVGVSVASSS